MVGIAVGSQGDVRGLELMGQTRRVTASFEIGVGAVVCANEKVGKVVWGSTNVGDCDSVSSLSSGPYSDSELSRWNVRCACKER